MFVSFFCSLSPQKTFQFVIMSDLLRPGKSTFVFRVLPARLCSRDGDSSDCHSAVTQTHSPSVSPLQMQRPSLSWEQYASRYYSADPTIQQCIYEHTHPCVCVHASKRNMPFSSSITWALFALVNVNVSTIFAPASALPGQGCTARDPSASHIELTCFFFSPFPGHTNAF